MTLPYYDRYTQAGKDSAGRQIGVPAGTPTGREQGWKFIQAVPGRPEQVPEWNELQTMLQDQIKDIGDYVLIDGQSTGLNLRIDLKSKPKPKVYVEWADPTKPGRVYARGQFHNVPASVVEIDAEGLGWISAQLTKRVITEVEDPSLNDPTLGSDNYGAPGAYRWVYDVAVVWKTGANKDKLGQTYDLWTIQDGNILQATNDTLTEVDRHLITYTGEITGDCLARGMRVQVFDDDADTNGTLRVTIDEGRAFVAGRMVGYRGTTTRKIAKAKTDSRDVYGAPVVLISESLSGGSGAATLKKSYLLNAPAGSRPIKTVKELIVPIVVKKYGVVGAGGSAGFALSNDASEVILPDQAPFGPVLGRVISVRNLALAEGQQYIGFTSTQRGFRPTQPLAAGTQIVVVWVFMANLAPKVDFDWITKDANGNVTDQSSVVLTCPNGRNYTDALTSKLDVDGRGDNASYVFPGISSTILRSVSSDRTVVVLDSTYGIIPGQALYFGNRRKINKTTQQTLGDNLKKTDDGNDFLYDEVAFVQSVPQDGSKRVQLSKPLASARAHQAGELVYSHPDFIGLNILADTQYEAFIDYAWLLDRIDVVYIDQFNNLGILTGQSGSPAITPQSPSDVLPLVKIKLKANGDAKDMVVETFPVKRLSQADLQKLLQRVELNEYNQLIDNLKKAVYNKGTVAGGSLRGILTDAFLNSDIADILFERQGGQKMTSGVSIDPDEGVLHTALTAKTSTVMSVDATRSSCHIGPQALTLGYGQPVASSSASNPKTTYLSGVADAIVVQGVNNVPKPTIVVTNGDYLGLADRNDTFDFYNAGLLTTEKIPKEMEGGSWKVRQNTLPWLQNRLLYIPPSHSVGLRGRNISSGIYKVAIDGVVMKNADGSDFQVVVVDADSGVFPAGSAEPVTIPINRFLVSAHNTRTIALLASDGSEVAKTIFAANASAARFMPLPYDSLATIPHVPLAQTFALDHDAFVQGVAVTFIAPTPTAWVEVQLRTVTQFGQPGDQILASKRLSATSVGDNEGNNILHTAPAVTKVIFDDPVFCTANAQYAICFVSPSAEFSVAKVLVGHLDDADPTKGTPVGVKPIASGNVYVSLDGANWMVETNSSLTVSVLECNFDTTKNLVVFNPVLAQDLYADGTKLSLWLARLQQMLPRSTSVDWSYTVNNDVAEFAFSPDVAASMSPQKLATPIDKITVIGRIRGSNKVSAIVGRLNPTILSFVPKSGGIYATRLVQNAPQFDRARVVLQVAGPPGVGSIDVKFAPRGDADGVASVILTGSPMKGDSIVLEMDGLVFKAPPPSPTTDPPYGLYQNSAQTLQDFGDWFAGSNGWLRNDARFGAAYRASSQFDDLNNRYVVTIRRLNGRAFVPGDLNPMIKPALNPDKTIIPRGDTLLVQPTQYQFLRLVTTEHSAVAVDAEFKEYTFTTPTDPSFNVYGDIRPATDGEVANNTRQFRVQVELLGSDPTNYPRIRNFGAIVTDIGSGNYGGGSTAVVVLPNPGDTGSGDATGRPRRPEGTSFSWNVNTRLLSWDAVPGAVTYNLYRNGLPFAIDIDTNQIYLGPAVTGYFAVSAVNALGESPLSTPQVLVS